MLFVLIFLLGGLGAVSRYGISLLFSSVQPFWCTLFINIIGSFMIGAIYSFQQSREVLPHLFYVAMMIGFLGGFTTFSSFSFDSISLFQSEQWGLAFANLALSNVLGLLFCLLGIKIINII